MGNFNPNNNVASLSKLSGLGSNVATFLGTPSSANLLAALTTKTGTGNAVFNTSPTLITPILGASTATSINKVTITAPATSSTITIANGSSLITSGAFSTTLTSTAATNVTLPTTGTLATLAGTETLSNKTLISPAFTTSVTTASTTFSLFDTGATTINAFGAANNIAFGKADGVVNFGTARARLVSGPIQMGRRDGVSDTPFLDFHSSGGNYAYDARIIASGGGVSFGQGSFTYHANSGHNFLGAIVGSGYIKSNSSVGGIGYDTGAGGSVTQITSKSTAVAINAMCGVITTHTEQLVSGASVTFAVSNSSIGPNDTVQVITRAAVSSSYEASVFGLNSPFNSFIVKLTNNGITASEAVVINFTIIRGASA